MEPAGSMVEGGEWSSFNGVYVNEEADFMAQLFPSCSLTHEVDGASNGGVGEATCWSAPESNFLMAGTVGGSSYSSDNTNSNLYFSQGSSYGGCGNSSSSSIFPASGLGSYYLSDCHQFLPTNNSTMSIDFFMADAKNNSFQLLPNNRMEGDDCLNPEMSGGSLEESSANLTESELADKHLQLKTESEVSELDLASEDKYDNLLSDNKKKRHRVSDVQKGKRNVRSKKYQKLELGDNNDEGHKATLNRQNSCNFSSEDESNGSQEPNGGDISSLSSKGNSALNLSGKSRASRGSATDPQSLYARRRRERINERLRTLQNLVPNGTKVDISTMLEEAVQYVKFLQLQIKLLSSDDLWMYAPIAYNGMDIGL